MADMQGVKAKFEEVLSRGLVTDILGAPRPLKPVLSNDDVISFQKKFNVQLPEDYVFYLTKIANGGLGPSLDMIALDLSGVKDPRIDCKVEDADIDLGVNFPFEYDWNDKRVLQYEGRLPVRAFSEKCEAVFG